MKDFIFDARFIIACFVVFFSIALLDLLVYNPTAIYNALAVLHWWGKLSFAMAVLSLVWMFIHKFVARWF
jgi:hypothetical protein